MCENRFPDSKVIKRWEIIENEAQSLFMKCDEYYLKIQIQHSMWKVRFISQLNIDENKNGPIQYTAKKEKKHHIR